MSNDLTTTNAIPLALPRATLTPVSLTFEEGTTADEWVQAFRILRRCNVATFWWLGDALNFALGSGGKDGKRTYCRYRDENGAFLPNVSKVLQETQMDYSDKTLANIKSLSSKIPVEIRTIPSMEISFSKGNLAIPQDYWTTIAPLDLDLQKHWVKAMVKHVEKFNQLPTRRALRCSIPLGDKLLSDEAIDELSGVGSGLGATIHGAVMRFSQWLTVETDNGKDPVEKWTAEKANQALGVLKPVMEFIDKCKTRLGINATPPDVIPTREEIESMKPDEVNATWERLKPAYYAANQCAAIMSRMEAAAKKAKQVTA